MSVACACTQRAAGAQPELVGRGWRPHSEFRNAKRTSPRAAAFKAMDEVSGPVIAVGLVLSAVFIPCAFLTGIVGEFFRQFALTIAVSTIISTFNSPVKLKPLSVTDAKKAGFTVLKRVSKGEYERQ